MRAPSSRQGANVPCSLATHNTIAAIDALGSDCLWVEIGRENAEHAINVHQIGPVLIKLWVPDIPDVDFRYQRGTLHGRLL
jgi:hypothetical protein